MSLILNNLDKLTCQTLLSGFALAYRYAKLVNQRTKKCIALQATAQHLLQHYQQEITLSMDLTKDERWVVGDGVRFDASNPQGKFHKKCHIRQEFLQK